MQEFVVGSRWVVDAEPELGLGMVVDLDARAVTLVFPQAESERMYARAKAPLTRIVFAEGDTVHTRAGEACTVKAVHEREGLAFYDIGVAELLPETALASEVKMNQPFLRLMTGQLDAPKFFAFRRQLDAAIARVWQAQLTGFLGVRANLIAHQLYVAQAATARERVRVLLADEVGLGKTLEAGMILARLLRAERVDRALVLVPDALLVQWLVELIRRFQIRPDLYSGAEHDFALGAVQLAPHSLLAEETLPEAFFDTQMVIVDEAHHLVPGSTAFRHLERLATAPHLVLLSATPEQLGVASHFARLQLLDPAKFESLAQFVGQEQSYIELNQKIQALPAGRDDLVRAYGLSTGTDEQIITQLLDCHGIGRVMFRNTRSSVTGFPGRATYAHAIVEDTAEARHAWLADFLKARPRDKVLVITHSLADVKAAEVALWQGHGLDVAVFHEEMDLIERDRAAAYFADLEMGAQALICSEIGSEGRNFQFSHLLVCLDLPQHPEVLEQRIGRLDRIGQQHTVEVHVPCAPASSTAQLYHWYHQVLQCIDRQNPAAAAVHDRFFATYEAGANRTELEAEASAQRAQLEADIAAGRDALLERNSCRQPHANALAERIAAFESDTPLALVEAAADLFNFHFEETHTDVYALIPADNMLIPALPGIPPEGVEVTFLREVANAREEVQFLSWDAPFIVGLWELLHHSDLGSASVALLPSKQLPAGQCLLETCFDLLIQAPNRPRCLPFMPALSLRVLVLDISDKDLSKVLPEQALESNVTRVDKKLARKIIASRKEQLPAWYQKAEGFAQVQLAPLLAAAKAQANDYYEAEKSRLEQLARLNPSVDDADIALLAEQQRQVLASLEHKVVVQLSAIRLIVTTEP